MGQYNPHAPHILGHEWVPIRNAFYVPDTVTERGYTFQLNTTTVPVSGAYYVVEVPDHMVAQSCDFISVYPTGKEDQSGPIKKLHIPASGVALSPNPPFVIDISEGPQALNNPSDNKSIRFDPNAFGESDELWVTFDTASYSQQLLGKRILDLRIRYAVLAFDPAEAASHLDFGINQPNLGFGDAVFFTGATQISQNFEGINYFTATDLNPFWDATVGPSSQRDIYPWRFQELDRFRTGYLPGASALVVSLSWSSSLTTAFLGFLDLEVIYCEETRVLYGGRRTTNINISGALTDFYGEGAQAVRLRGPNLLTGTSLSAGEYTVTLSHRDMAANSIYQGAPKIYATRQYYGIPGLRDVRVNLSLTEGDTLVQNDNSNVVTHITLHTAASIVTGVHAYGTSVGAPVYGSRTAIQEIEDNPSTTGPYPQVRFYARRYGDTMVPLTLTDVATGLSTVSISVADFDALPEIVDGWREVTLRFATAPTFPVTADDVDWRWSATGELAGNQWQILVSSGPTGSWNPSPTAAATGPATYWAPFGSNVGLTWQSPTISGTAFDTSSDAVLIFSQDPPAVTGFAVATTTLPVSGSTQFCVTPRCVPTGIYGNRLSWSAFGVCDSFERVETSTWGVADTGQTWTNTGGVAGNYNLDGHSASHTLTTANSSRNSTIAAQSADQHAEVYDLDMSQVASGNVIAAGLLFRHLDTSNRYYIEVNANTDSTVSLVIRKQVAGVITDLASLVLPDIVHYVDAKYNIIGEVIGTTLRGKAWQTGAGNDVPGAWQLLATDSALTAAGSNGLRSIVGAGNVNTVISYASFTAVYAALAGASLEIQRQDDVDTDWKTIMASTTAGVCPIRFDDFEARVGIQSRYRMRVLNALDFAGPWATGAGTIPSPGVVVGGDASSILIFTSNANVAASLAYVMQFFNQPAEAFTFPEADTVALQRLFGRDFFLAIRPLERGGEKFTRTILVNNAAIALPSLANFRDLRNLAWADLDYVCVRDELGNRWLATIVVPDGEVRGNRTIYLARIDVTEVTDTPTPVNP